MTKQEFFERIKDGVVEHLRNDDPTLEGVINQVTKINNIVYNGLSFKSENTRVAPVIYLDQFFDRFTDEDLTIDDIVERVASIYKEHMGACHDISVDGITDYEQVKNRIVPAICNADSCTEYLKDMPHVTLHDLSVYYRILIDIGKDGEGSVAVSSYLMKSWGIFEEQLKEQAWKNLHEMNPPDCQPMFNILKNMMPAYEDSAFPEEADCSMTMRVLTNKSRTNGAIYMADTETLAKIAADIDSDLIILPSSRHETILLPFDMAATPERWKEMQTMVSEINHGGTVSAEDFLSDSVYAFHRDTMALEKVA